MDCDRRFAQRRAARGIPVFRSQTDDRALTRAVVASACRLGARVEYGAKSFRAASTGKVWK